MSDGLYWSQPVTIYDAIKYASDSGVSKMVIKKETRNLTLFIFNKGQVLGKHTAPFDAALMVLDGTSETFIRGESLFLH